ncbi:MAG: polymer-forming cytoskeletal protein [Acidobacteria bacterium]|nr:polymer-forming cytoskeletal protein [Acidobacteriota bacterium]
MTGPVSIRSRRSQRPDAGGVGPATRSLLSTIGEHTRVHGEVVADADLIVEGTVIGDMDLPGHALTIAEGGSVTGTVFARLVDVAGTVSGSITASDRVEFLPSARVSAEVSAPRVVLADGARFGGRIDMRNTEAAVRVARYRLDKKLGAR